MNRSRGKIFITRLFIPGKNVEIALSSKIKQAISFDINICKHYNEYADVNIVSLNDGNLGWNYLRFLLYKKGEMALSLLWYKTSHHI